MAAGRVILSLFTLALYLKATEGRSFTIDYDHNTFLKDGKPFRYVSGAIHYFRVPRELWADRLYKLRYAGFNAVQTYVEWSSHQPYGPDNVTHVQDLVDYIKEAQNQGLLVVLRPGPFIDSERDFGGFPWWFFREDPNMKIRSTDASYQKYVDKWFSILLSAVRPLLYVNGGPIISVQVENEYALYGCDLKYISWLRDTMKKYLVDDVILFATDPVNLKCSKVDGVYGTVDFGTGGDPAKNFQNQRAVEPKGPLVNSEFYPGWLDHWGQPHSHVTTEATVDTLDKMLAMNASVNMYLAHGGTSYGFKSGSNWGDPDNTFWPCPTSYDFDAPISEAGDPTDKYWAVRNVIGKYLPLPSGPAPVISPKMGTLPIAMHKYGSALDITLQLGKNSTSQWPQSFEQLGQPEGYVLYATKITVTPADPSLLSVPGLRDRALVYVDGVYVGTLSRTEKILSLPIQAYKGSLLFLLVENQGRICFGPYIGEQKGIVSNVTLGPVTLQNWEHYWSLESEVERVSNIKDEKVLSSLSKVYQPGQQYGLNAPVIYYGFFFVAGQPLDTFLRLDGWGKGVAVLNGFNLGRYWPNQGPQVTLYAPAHLFKTGLNTVAVLETETAPCGQLFSPCSVQFVTKHVLNGTTPFQ